MLNAKYWMNKKTGKPIIYSNSLPFLLLDEANLIISAVKITDTVLAARKIKTMIVNILQTTLTMLRCSIKIDQPQVKRLFDSGFRYHE
ncbi:hypothetical protein [Spartinivicinus poritis]|uniref:Uncharacterized protein n=1 Tax=Spartinivicinus poritis TaxID=2994640 RepID=A0ABT5UGB4_9GAMM|nr:hypothetical protein [Spartinivicinus sp. A2-2]MDE1464114.1 hypothetical protein [Spartinivicinus sp. A2-2]